MIQKSNRIKVGDIFNAYVLKGRYSKTLLGEEGAGKLAVFCPQKAIVVDNRKIESETSYYYRNRFSFEKVKAKKGHVL